jgi:collagenase-like PrtC family protease
MGGDAVIVSDVSMLLTLHRHESRLIRRLSLLAGVFNRSAACFFREHFGVERIVLPRELRRSEIESITREKNVQWEALALDCRCTFIDGFCGFHHLVRITDRVPTAFEYIAGPQGALAYADDPDFEGHGCSLDWTPPICRPPDSIEAPGCAACQLPWLRAAGVRYFKVGGRGYPLEVLERNVRFLKRALAAAPDAARTDYRETFGTSCNGERCFYSVD